MAGETPKKPRSRMNGNDTGVPFGVQPQPTPEAKKAGWQELRARRLLTQAIIKEMFGDDGVESDSFKGYIKALVDNAKMGNAKAIDTINSGIEEQVVKTEVSVTKGANGIIVDDE